MNDVIDNFSGENSFLSNFSPAVTLLDGDIYPTVEHAYQAAKTEDLAERGEIHSAETPGRAKRLGRKVTIREDWEDIKLEVMEYFLKQKFSIPILKDKLLNTYPKELIEGNTWGDTFWGVCDGKGKNHLGKLLMKIRDEMIIRERINSATE